MTTKAVLGFFIVKKSGRIVDCIKARDLSLAFAIAMGKWEKTLKGDQVIEVSAMPEPRMPRVVFTTGKGQIGATPFNWTDYGQWTADARK